MFLDWKNQHCENDSTTQSNLQIQCNPYQTTNGIFHRTRTKNFTICIETQKTPNSQSNPEEENQSWRNQAPGLETILQSYSNQDSMVLAQKQKYRSVEQDRKPRDKPMHKKGSPWASLVAQWLRICLPMQGTRVRALVWEDPTCRGATRPVSHNC